MTNFYKNFTPQELKNYHKIYSQKRNRTKDGLIKAIYQGQKGSSIARGHNAPEYCIKWFTEWMCDKQFFHNQYDKWVKSGYDKDVKPSVDRIEDNVGYTKDNIQITTWKINREKSYKDTRSGKLKNGSRPQIEVSKYSLDGCFIESFVSIMEAKRQTGISNGHISECCNNKRKSAGGFLWKISKS